MDRMKRQARSESLLLQFYKCTLPPPSTVTDLVTGQRDEQSISLLRDYCGWLLARFVPMSVRGDGNCLFRAVSKSLYGCEDYYLLLRLLTVIEVLSCQEFYDISNSALYGPFKAEIDGALKLVPYDQFVTELSRDGSYCDLLAVLAVSSVIQKPIQTVWPITVKPGEQSPFNKLLKGRDVVSGKHPVYLLWTTCTYKGFQTVNAKDICHFVPLFEVTSHDDESILVDSDGLGSESDTSDNEQNFGSSQSVPSKLDSVADERMKSDSVISSDHFKLTSGFLSMTQCLDLLKTLEIDQIMPDVPGGPKNNVYFLVDNSANIAREIENKQRVFWDDCGAWDQHRTVTQYYLRNSLKEIRFVGGKYCTRKKVDGKFVTEVMDEQPAEGQVYEVCRFYAKLKRDNNYKKRSTWLRNGPPIAVIEYLGVFPQEVLMHGNCSKGAAGEYIRSHPDVISHIKLTSSVTKQTPKQTYKQMVINGSQEQAKPRNLKQIQNHFTQTSDTNSSKNFADEIQTLCSLVAENHPFVKCVIVDEESAPSVILFTTEQIADIRRFCGNDVDGNLRSVLGVDRTFNLSSLFVTVTVFKNNSVVRTSTQQPPIFIGPVMLHGDGKFKTYLMFFARLVAALSTSLSSTEVRLQEQILTGSDEESALVKAIRTMFPNSKHLFCMIHCKDNVRHHLNKIGVPLETREHVLRLLFGAGGVVAAADDKTLEMRISAVMQYVRQSNIDAVDYLQTRILPKISDNVKIIWQNSWLGIYSWTNNNCESINNLLKLDLDWKPARLTDLVSHIHDLVRLQYEDVRRAMFGRGDFHLAPQFAKHYVPFSHWTVLSEEAQHRLFDEFLSDNGSRQTSGLHTIASSDGCLTVKGSNKIARKPGQRRRPKSERSAPKQM